MDRVYVNRKAVSFLPVAILIPLQFAICPLLHAAQTCNGQGYSIVFSDIPATIRCPNDRQLSANFEIIARACMRASSGWSINNCLSQNCPGLVASTITSFDQIGGSSGPLATCLARANQSGDRGFVGPGSTNVGSANQGSAMAKPYPDRDPELWAQCDQNYEKAEECCDAPLKCAFGIEMFEQASPALLNQILQAAGYAASGGDQAKSCEIQKNLNAIMGGINVYVYGRCMLKVNDCRDACDRGKDIAAAYLRQNNCSTVLNRSYDSIPEVEAFSGPAGSDTGTTREIYSRCLQARADESQFRDHWKNCKDDFNDHGREFAQQAALNLQQFLQSEQCQKLASEPDPFPPVDTPQTPTVDCTNAANASSPACVANCSAPGASTNNPLCRGFSPGVAGGGSVTDLASRNVKAGDNPRANLGALAEPDQETPFAPIEVGKASSKGISGNGSGGLPGSSSGGGSPFSASSAGRPGGSGFNTNIGNPTARAGYRVSGAGAPSSEGGYSSPAGRGAGANGGEQPLSLRSLQQGNRSIAGLGSPRAIKDISKAHEDIFNKITNAMFRQCETNTYEDCANNIRVNAKPGG